MSLVTTCTNEFKASLDIHSQTQELYASNPRKLRQILLKLVQSALQRSSSGIVQISVRTLAPDETPQQRLPLEDGAAMDSSPANFCPEPDVTFPITSLEADDYSQLEMYVHPWDLYNFPPCTILLVDSLGETHLALTQILKKYNFAWIHVYDVTQMPVQVEQRLPDLVLLDVGFPATAQMEMVRKMRDWEKNMHQSIVQKRRARGMKVNAAQQKIPVIAFSSYADEGEDARLIRCGCSDVLHKPLSPAALIEKLVSWLAAWEEEENPAPKENHISKMA